jgi:UMF1 family MFS transporter
LDFGGLDLVQYSYKYLPSFDNKTASTKFFDGFQELKKVWSTIERHCFKKGIWSLFFVYSMAVQTVMIAATFGEKKLIGAVTPKGVD